MIKRFENIGQRKHQLTEHAQAAVCGDFPVSMRDADNIDEQRVLYGGRLQQPFRRLPHHGHHVRPQDQQPESYLRHLAQSDSVAFEFGGWTPELDGMLLAETYNPVDSPSIPWPNTYQHPSPSTASQREPSSSWFSHFGPHVPEEMPDAVGLGSWAVGLAQDEMLRQASTMSHSADPTFGILPVADTNQLLMPAHMDLEFVPQSDTYAHAIDWSPVPELFNSSPIMHNPASAVLGQGSVEKLLNLRTGETKAVPPKRKHRQQTAEKLANRDLIRRLGGACGRCKKKKRQVSYLPRLDNAVS